MRGFKKFLFKNKWHAYCFFFKKRLLRLNRPKWRQIQSKINNCRKDLNINISKIIQLNNLKIFKYIKILKKKLILKKKIKKPYIFFLKKLNYFLKNYYFFNLKNNINSQLKYYFDNRFKHLKHFFKKNLKRFFFFYQFINLSHFLSRYRYFFKNLLFMKSTVLKYFNGCFSVKFFKKLSLTSIYKQNLISFFIKPEFRLDILLWRLKFFISPYLARFAFQKNLIFINNNLTFSFYFFKQHFKRCLKGIQLISLKSELKYSFNINLNHFVKSLFLSTFLEIDYYLGNVIILKNFKNLNFKDINSFLKEPLSFNKFKDSIIK
jgi:hypothetical protein